MLYIFGFSKKKVFDVDVHLGILKMFPRTDISVRLYIYKEFRTKIEIFQFHSALHSRESFNLENLSSPSYFTSYKKKPLKVSAKSAFFLSIQSSIFLTWCLDMFRNFDMWHRKWKRSLTEVDTFWSEDKLSFGPHPIIGRTCNRPPISTVEKVVFSSNYQTIQ